MSDRVRLGQEAEDAAAEFLLAKGLTLVTRRYRVPGGEIDLVALDGEILVFVEVKRRDAPGYDPRRAIGPKKAEALDRAALRFRQDHGLEDREFRFDLIAVEQGRIDHMTDIFGND